jgi:hypothetical protein
MRYGIEVSLQIRVINLALPCSQIFPDLFQCLVGVSPWSKSIGTIFKICLEDRLQDQQHRRLHDAIPHRRDPERPQLAVGFGDVDPAHRRAPIGLFSQFFAKGFKPLLGSLVFDLLDADPVDSCSSAVGPDLMPGPFSVSA